MQGQVEFELSEQGIVQAKKLAQRLSAEAWRPSHIYSSPLRRATQTTQILVTHFESAPESLGDAQCPLKIEWAEELKELQNGVFQGLTWQEAQTLYPELCHALETSPEWLPIPQAESLQAASDRARTFVQTLINRHTNTDQIWIISHGGILQFLIAELLGCQRVWGLQINPTALFEFQLDLRRWHLEDQNRYNPALWQIHRFHDFQHLGLLSK